MRWSYRRVWWYRPLILSLANTGEVLYRVNRRTTCRDIDMRGLVVLSLALGIALIPCSLIGQEEEQEEGRDWTGGLVTGGGVGTAASSLAAAGLCASSGYDARTCAADGALYGFLPGLASGYGLSYPDRTTWKGRLRTVALGSAGGLLTVLALRLAADRNPPVYALWSGRGRFRGPALWGTGVGLMSAFVGPSVQAYLFPSPASPEAGNASPLALGLAFRFPLP